MTYDFKMKTIFKIPMGLNVYGKKSTLECDSIGVEWGQLFVTQIKGA
jgi:hypothetical protein